ncbi:MAG: cytochrome C oxidase subunit II [Bacteroidetes bacterium GWF2_33_38]|nr:MAG: cytochrome C oxidase subunit II [Bacteroidetes bacterium GWF2_33_38]OFY73120.1 MAG: cytochrome C oxidase subunit II [Bacteroidetes bacterium RIFOXYA12_FULL_33_9]OFY88470.1 MAG: cytochrome C oxidase subunit II [Bacteroidetes bacterium RIFOXYA2_FULL_33_7]HBX51491.1 cytochrome ubiquinol oxidase subunit I [Bacteroidales bacterium]
MNEIDISLVDWSRAQFALTAIYHWLFVPLTLGLSFMLAIMETIYVKTGDEGWKKIVKFWMTLFGINFAIGVSTGIILEFEFGTNWSNYSWLVGDIFGAPLAIEGIMAFFMESTFIAIMFFGWNKVSKKFHLLSTWLVAIGSNLSALWILVANAWMQSPVGMKFNPDSARSEMQNFWEVLFSPMAINKFLHTVSSSYVVAALFVIGVSAWYILKKRNILFAKKSIVVGATFGLLASIFVAVTGDGSAYEVAQKQPAKLAAMEGLYDGQKGAGLIMVGMLNHDKEVGDQNDAYHFKIEIPKMLSLLGYRNADAFVPGINDLVYGNSEQGIISTQEKIEKGKIAITALAEYKKAKEQGDIVLAQNHKTTLEQNYKYIGYGYLDSPESIVPNVPLTFYSFHIMVALGFFFIALFAFILFMMFKNKLENKKWLLRLALWSIPLGYLASELGWVVAEVGRQPWAIQDMLPVNVATTHIDVTSVQITFWLFATLFSILLIAELRILTKQIKIGPKGGENV